MKRSVPYSPFCPHHWPDLEGCLPECVETRAQFKLASDALKRFFLGVDVAATLGQARRPPVVHARRLETAVERARNVA